jgi:hypothetical protein
MFNGYDSALSPSNQAAFARDTAVAGLTVATAIYKLKYGKLDGLEKFIPNYKMLGLDQYV